MAEVIKVVDLSSYQPGAIVSRTLINKVNGSVTFFAFAQGQGLSEHTAPYDALVHVVEGELEVLISGKYHHLQAGDMVIMPANQPHALKAISDLKMILTMVKT